MEDADARAANTRIEIESLRSPEALARHAEAWRELADHALEPNPFFEPFFLSPALEHLSTAGDVRVLLVWQGQGSERRLIGLVPIERAQINAALPLPAWTPWKHKYCFHTVPLVDERHAMDAVRALLNWFAERGSLARLTNTSGSLLDLLTHSAAAEAGMSLVIASSQIRALFRPSASADHYLDQSISGRHRKGYRRLERQLAAGAPLDYRRIAPHALNAADLDQWIEDFLRLEAAGWKGRGQTAFQNLANEREFFQSMIRGAHAAGRLMALGLYRSGIPVALKVNLLSGHGSFAFKICYDENYARFSPGVLLELENIRQLHELGIHWMDSCADEGHPMIERLWPGRREVQTLFLSKPTRPAGIIVPPLATVRRWKDQASRMLRAS